MCLTLKNESVEVQIAKRDITVYKCLDCTTIKTIEQVKDGDEFTGIIKDVECSGKIHKPDYDSLYFCTNSEFLDGKRCTEKFGYQYSWWFDGRVKSVVVNGVELIKKVVIKRLDFETPYQGFTVEIGETYTSELIKEFKTVEKGLHSFSKLKDAKRNGADVYAKCIIPKGSQYYVGKFGCLDSYASDKLTYVKLVK